MAWVAVDKDGSEWVYNDEPIKDRDSNVYLEPFWGSVELPSGSIEKLIGRKLTWEDEPVELI